MRTRRKVFKLNFNNFCVIKYFLLPFRGLVAYGAETKTARMTLVIISMLCSQQHGAQKIDGTLNNCPITFPELSFLFLPLHLLRLYLSDWIFIAVVSGAARGSEGESCFHLRNAEKARMLNGNGAFGVWRKRSHRVKKFYLMEPSLGMHWGSVVLLY